MGQTALVLTVYLLAVMRLVRLITADTILDPMRIAIARRARDPERPDPRRSGWAWLEELLGCPWCVGLWLSVAAAGVPVALLGWPWWSLLPLGLACSQLIGMAAPLYTDDEIAFEPVNASP